jgi:hypothetical protein
MKRTLYMSCCILFVVVGSISFSENASAQADVELIVEPDINRISLEHPEEIALIVYSSQQNLKYLWSIQGPGTLMGEKTSPGVLYVPPKVLEKSPEEVKITVTITDHAGEVLTRERVFTLIAPVTPTPTPTSTLTPSPSPSPEPFTLDIVLDPDMQSISLGSAPSKIVALAVHSGSQDVRYRWKLDGPGKFSGESSDPLIFYLPPEKIEGRSDETIISCTITDHNNRTLTRRVPLTLLASPPPLTPTPTATPIPTPTPTLTPALSAFEKGAQYPQSIGFRNAKVNWECLHQLPAFTPKSGTYQLRAFFHHTHPHSIRTRFWKDIGNSVDENFGRSVAISFIPYIQKPGSEKQFVLVPENPNPSSYYLACSEEQEQIMRNYPQWYSTILLTPLIEGAQFAAGDPEAKKMLQDELIDYLQHADTYDFISQSDNAAVPEIQFTTPGYPPTVDLLERPAHDLLTLLERIFLERTVDFLQNWTYSRVHVMIKNAEEQLTPFIYTPPNANLQIVGVEIFLPEMFRNIDLSSQMNLYGCDPIKRSSHNPLLYETHCEIDTSSNLGTSEYNDWDNLSKPIDNLFKAWETLDIDLYMKQWHKDAIQVSNKFHRNYDEIKATRIKNFNEFKKVIIKEYRIIDTILMENSATLIVEYSMQFNLKDGRQLHENNVKEKYVLVYDPETSRWLIKENHDYVEKAGMRKNIIPPLVISGFQKIEKIPQLLQENKVILQLTPSDLKPLLSDILTQMGLDEAQQITSSSSEQDSQEVKIDVQWQCITGGDSFDLTKNYELGAFIHYGHPYSVRIQNWSNIGTTDKEWSEDVGALIVPYLKDSESARKYIFVPNGTNRFALLCDPKNIPLMTDNPSVYPTLLLTAQTPENTSTEVKKTLQLELLDFLKQLPPQEREFTETFIPLKLTNPLCPVIEESGQPITNFYDLLTPIFSQKQAIFLDTWKSDRRIEIVPLIPPFHKDFSFSYQPRKP